jgi:HD-like signal output (HDOD) protein
LSLVAVDKLKEGWVLSEDVRDVNGRLMLSKGQRIDRNHIRIFKIWGIPEVIVDKPAEPAPAGQGDKQMEKLQKVEHCVTMILSNIDPNHPAIREIWKAAVEYRYQNDLLIEFEGGHALPENFKLNLARGFKTQIEFSEMQLPETPTIIMEFSQVIEDPLSSANDIADVVTRSPSLSALLLKLVNSAFYGLQSKVDTISRAVTLIGVKEIRSMILGIEIMRLFHNIPRELVDMSAFLRHSLACGILSRILAAQKKLQHTERLFVAGLLHDIGRLVWYKYFSEQARLLLSMAKRTELSLYEIERECLGVSHEQIAGHLFKKWHIPDSLENIIVYHHAPSRSNLWTQAAIVHMADIAVNAIGLGHSGERILARFEPRTWDRLQIVPNALKTAMEQTIEQVEVMMKIFTEA